MLNGVNPVVVQKCTSIPSKFAITNDLVKPFLNRGLTLEQEMQVMTFYWLVLDPYGFTDLASTHKKHSS